MYRDEKKKIKVVLKVFEKEPELRDSWIKASLTDFFYDASLESYQSDLEAVVTCFAPHNYQDKNPEMIRLFNILSEIGKRLDKDEHE